MSDEAESVTGTPRSVSLDRLRRTGFDADRPGLVQALTTGTIAVRVEAAFVLGSDPDLDDGALAALRAALTDEDARVRVEAAYWLAARSPADDAAARALLHDELAGEPFDAAPLRAAVALAKLGDPSGYPRVLELLDDPLPSNRMEAAAARRFFQTLR